ncbi:sigma factor [Peribacillus frigoritolerans]|uniref:sigma factor n=1 Tax=Peribacillus frigoritolerans TaxID=450367 RepID=UPI002E21C232|nr:sigma factor [Peribacillus frigoritolerans]
MEFENDKMVKKAIRGNKKAFEQLIKQHYERIYRTAYLYVHNEEDALDVVQETTYQAYNYSLVKASRLLYDLAYQDHYPMCWSYSQKKK